MKRSWRAGDVIELQLPMPGRLVEANPKAEHQRNQVAVMRGPLLYCLESPDLPEGLVLDRVRMALDGTLEVARVEGLPESVRALRTRAVYADEEPWSGELYRTLRRGESRPIDATLIPYYTWANRGPSAMSVWLPIAHR